MIDTAVDKKRKFGSGFFGVLQRVGRAFMLPIALLPIAGLLWGHLSQTKPRLRHITFCGLWARERFLTRFFLCLHR